MITVCPSTVIFLPSDDYKLHHRPLRRSPPYHPALTGELCPPMKTGTPPPIARANAADQRDPPYRLLGRALLARERRAAARSDQSNPKKDCGGTAPHSAPCPTIYVQAQAWRRRRETSSAPPPAKSNSTPVGANTFVSHSEPVLGSAPAKPPALVPGPTAGSATTLTLTQPIRSPSAS